MAFVNPFFVKNPLIDKPRESCFFALEMKNKKSAPRKERKKYIIRDLWLYQYRKTAKGAVDDSQIQKLSIEQKIGIRESLVNDHRRPHHEVYTQ